MLVAFERFDLRIPACASLKEKRHVVKTLTAAIRQKFNVSVAEVDHHDLWQRTALGVSVVATDGYHAKRVLHEVESSSIDGARSTSSTPTCRFTTRRTSDMTEGTRPSRVPEEFREILAEEIPRLKDPRVGFVTVTGVKVTPDLRRAIVFYTAMGDDRDRRATGRRAALGAAHLRQVIGARYG